eukprot:436248-Pleurochrysis_carterae.AAC.1
MIAEARMRLLRHDSGQCASGHFPRASAHIPDLSERGSHSRRTISLRGARTPGVADAGRD